MDRRPLALGLALAAALAALRCGPTEILVGDVPGLARIVAGVAGDSGLGADDGSALAEPLHEPMGVAAGPGGVFYVADTFNRVIRRVAVDLSQRIVAGSPTCTLFGGAPTTARGVCFGLPTAVATDAGGTVLIVADQSKQRVWRIDLALDSARVIFGTGASGRAADSAIADGAPTVQPTDVAVAADGTVYVAERGNNRVVRIEPPGGGTSPRVMVFAGRDPAGYGGDGLPARQARLSQPNGVAVAGDTVFIGDTGNNVVRRVVGGVIETIAGTGQRGYSGEGGPARQALFNTPTRLALVGLLVLVSDRGNRRVRSIALSSGLVATFLGTGDSVLGTDQRDAAATATGRPEGLATSGPHVYSADAGHHVIRRILVP